MARDAKEQRTPAERLLARKADRRPQDPHEISRRGLQTQRTLEGYISASSPPRWMDRVAEVDRGIARERERLEQAYRATPRRRWRQTVEAWQFDPELNELITQHNEWYPIERRLPVDLRTRDYVLVNGRTFRRPLLDADWALGQFPPEPA